MERVKLRSEDLGEREFNLEDAKRLVAIEHQIGVQLWTPTKGSKYEIIDGSLKPKSGTGTDKSA